MRHSSLQAFREFSLEQGRELLMRVMNYANKFKALQWKQLAYSSFFEQATVFSLLITVCFLFVLKVQDKYGNFAEFELFEFWHTKGHFTAWFASIWFIFIWAVVGTTAGCLRCTYDEDYNPEEAYIENLLSSLRSGIFEEALFRWSGFLLAITVANLANKASMDLYNHPLIEKIQLTVLGPATNFMSFDTMQDYLVNPENWTIGAGIVLSNAVFFFLHRQNGILNMINSWFMGLIFFFLLLTYGLIAAMAVHVVFNAVCSTVEYVVALARLKS